MLEKAVLFHFIVEEDLRMSCLELVPFSFGMLVHFLLRLENTGPFAIWALLTRTLASKPDSILGDCNAPAEVFFVFFA